LKFNRTLLPLFYTDDDNILGEEMSIIEKKNTKALFVASNEVGL